MTQTVDDKKGNIPLKGFVMMFGLIGRYSRKPDVLLQVTILNRNFGIG